MSDLETSPSAPPVQKMSVIEAQDAMAATFGRLEKLAWHFFAIARNLQVDLEDEEMPDREPGPDHLRFFTALSAISAYYDLSEILDDIREAAKRTHQDLIDDWAQYRKLLPPGSAVPPPVAKSERKEAPR
jgi:hypothetical protein